MLPDPKAVHVPPPAPTHVHVTPVIDAGNVSATVAEAALLGPAFDAVIVYVTDPPGTAVATPSVFVIERSAEVLTAVVVTELSPPGFGSFVDELTVAVLVIVPPDGIVGLTFTTSVKLAFPIPKDAFVQLTAPVAPTAGVVQLQPPGEASETKVVPAGTESARTALAAASGPAFEAVIV